MTNCVLSAQVVEQQQFVGGLSVCQNENWFSRRIVVGMSVEAALFKSVHASVTRHQKVQLSRGKDQLSAFLSRN